MSLSKITLKNLFVCLNVLKAPFPAGGRHNLRSSRFLHFNESDIKLLSDCLVLQLNTISTCSQYFPPLYIPLSFSLLRRGWEFQPPEDRRVPANSAQSGSKILQPLLQRPRQVSLPGMRSTLFFHFRSLKELWKNFLKKWNLGWNDFKVTSPST